MDTEEEPDSNKMEDIINTSLHEKSEDMDDTSEKQDSEKDVDQDVGDMLQNDGDIKLEDLEEQNDVDDNKEVGFFLNSSRLCSCSCFVGIHYL